MKNSNKIVSSLLSEISEEPELEKAHQSSLEFFYHQRKRYPYRSWIEIDINGIRSSHQINRNWSPALRICHYVDKNPNLQQNTWILCLETASQMMSTLWGMAARHLDCHPWHLHQGASLTHEEFHYQLDALLSIFNEVSILTTRSIKNRYSLDSRKELSVVLIDEIPLPADFNHDLLTNKNDVGNIYLKSSGTSGKESMAVLSRTSLRNRLPSKIPSTLATKTLQWLPIDNVSSIGIVFRTIETSLFVNPTYMSNRPEAIFELIEEYRLESIPTSTSLASKLIQLLRNDRVYDLSSLTLIGVGLESISLKVYDDFLTELKRHGAQAKVSFSYGLTEVGLVATSRSYIQEELPALMKAGNIPPLELCKKGVKVRIIDQNENILPHGITGEIQIHAPNYLIEGYLDETGELKPLELNEGWLKTGDLGTIDKRGLTVSGRSKDLIFVDGKNVSLAPVEEAAQASGLCELGSIGAVPIHTSKDLKDYLLFFTLKKEVSAKKAIKKLRKIASKKIGVGPKQIRHIPRSKLKITRTGKLNRRATLHYLLGEEDPSDTFHQYNSASAIPTRDFERHWKNPVHISIARAYAELLGCLSAPKAENNFFDDGGTSFLMAQFLGRVYHITSYQLLLSDFFVQPTLGNVFKLLELAKKNGLSTLQPGQCLERVRTLASDWKGERLSPQSLLFGFNTQGSRPPLFWIFNQANELELLSKALGKDQPLYGMRSLTQIQEIPELNDQSLSEISNAYLLELLAISHKRGFYLGGNCQGSIIAFWMARELSRLNLPPKQLFLMEWSFDWGPLDLPTTFLYGAESTTRHIYTAHKDTSTHYSNLSLGHPWKERFPQHQTRKISGNHGQFFEPENLSSLAKTILSVTNGL